MIKTLIDVGTMVLVAIGLLLAFSLAALPINVATMAVLQAINLR